jgi:hypothetical protein
MPFSPEVQKLIEQVETTSVRPVHVAEDPGMQLRATVAPARGAAPAHLIRFRPGIRHLDYLVASQLMFLRRRLALPPAERWDLAGTPAQQDVAIKRLGLDVFPDDFARNMVGQVINQLRSFPVGFRVDAAIRDEFPGLRPQQHGEIVAQLAEMEKALAPQFRGKFPRGIVDANTAMNAAFAIHWAGVHREPRYAIPFDALGYRDRAEELLSALEVVDDDPAHDRDLVICWAATLGLSFTFHFHTEPGND